MIKPDWTQDPSLFQLYKHTAFGDKNILSARSLRYLLPSETNSEDLDSTS